MRYKLPLAGVALLLSANGWAGDIAYYTIEEIDVEAEGAIYGPYPAAMSEDGTFIGTYSMKAYLSKDIDIGLPFTFNRACYYDVVFCELEFYGSETYGNLNYDNAAQAWRNAQSDAQYGSYSSYMMANTLVDGFDAAILPYDSGYYTTDVKVTDVIGDSGEDQFVLGYSSAPYDGGTREFVRRAFIKFQGSDAVTSLLPEFDTNGGFSSAYKIKEVTYGNGDIKTLVVGASSISFPEDDDSDDVQEYFQSCYFSEEDDQISTLNELVSCPGFDTQAWAWDVSGLTDATQEISGFSLASEWLDDNEDNDGSDATYSASALDINSSGIAVGVSTFEYSDSEQGARQRAIVMSPSDAGEYGAPVRISEAEDGISDEDDNLYNTWAIGINDSDLIIGNREYSAVKTRNKPTEFFVYDLNAESISFPLLNKKVLSTKQRLAGDSASKSGANSQAYDINESGYIVGKADDYDQTDPVYGGSPRAQSAFLYNNNTDESWFINDLICTSNAGVVTAPRYRISSATIINDAGQVLAEGKTYPTDTDYLNKTNGTEIAFKLTPVAGIDPDDSPNCWDSELLKNTDTAFERQGGATFWLWIFALPVLLIRRFIR